MEKHIVRSALVEVGFRMNLHSPVRNLKNSNLSPESDAFSSEFGIGESEDDRP